GHVDPFGVEHREPPARVEPGRIAVDVAPPATQVDEWRPGVPEADEPAIGDAPVLDPRLVVAGLLVPAQPDAALAEVRRQACGPEIGRLADVAVRVDDELGHGRHSAPARPPGSTCCSSSSRAVALGGPMGVFADPGGHLWYFAYGSNMCPA